MMHMRIIFSVAIRRPSAFVFLAFLHTGGSISLTRISMSSFVARYKQDWDELEWLLKRSRSWRPLSAQERERLDELYRRTTVHLARVSTRSTDQSLVDYLNRLTAAAHSVIYLPPRQSMVDESAGLRPKDSAGRLPAIGGRT